MMLVYGLCILLVIIIIYFATYNTPTYEKYLYGFWVAEADEFCESAEIDSMMVFIGEPTSTWTGRTRDMYVIIMPDTLNDSAQIKYRSGWGGVGIGKYSINAKIEFSDEQIWDEDIVITIDIIQGRLIIASADDGTVYADLVKSHDTTNITAVLDQ